MFQAVASHATGAAHSKGRKKELCPSCGAEAIRIRRLKWERLLKPWRVSWHKMECNVCYNVFWERAGEDE